MLETLQDLLAQPDIMLWMQVAAMSLSSIITEDGTMAATSVLLATKKISLAAFLLGNFIGINLGDVLLYGLGRGTIKSNRRPINNAHNTLKSFIIKRPMLTFWLVFASRFIPGTRVPIFVASGMGHYSFFWYMMATLVSAAVWVGIFYRLNDKVGLIADLNPSQVGLVILGFLLAYVLLYRGGKFLLKFL